MSRRLLRRPNLNRMESRVTPDATYHVLSAGPFSQDWTNTGLITANDDWAGVPSIIGYRGDGLTGGTAVDPQTVLGVGTPVVDVNANQTAPNSFFTGGTTEFELANPAVALAGSGTARAPHIILHLDTTGVTEDIKVQYTLRDLEDGGDNAIQPIALQYRIGDTGDFINLPDGFVADATAGPNVAGPDIAKTVIVPNAFVGGQAKVQLRWITTDAAGSDEWVGIDDIVISKNAVGTIINQPPVLTVPAKFSSPEGQTVTFGSTTGQFISVFDPDSDPGSLEITLKALRGTFAVGTKTGVTVTGDTTAEVKLKGNQTDLNAALDGVVYTPQAKFFGPETLTVLANDLGNTGDDGPKTDSESVAVTITPAFTPFPLAGGKFTQDWSNKDLITTNHEWFNVPHIIGFRGDNLTMANDVNPNTVLTDGTDLTPIDVTANQSNPNTFTSGGIVEFDGLANPVVAFQGSGTADAPFLVISLDTTGVDNVRVQYLLRDVDGSADNAAQQVGLQYRFGGSGPWTAVPEAYVADATTGPNLAVAETKVNVLLPFIGQQPLVQLRIITTNATGSDEFVGVDDIVIASEAAGTNNPPLNVVPGAQALYQDTSLTFSGATSNAITVSDIENDTNGLPVQVTLKAENGTLTLSGTTGLTFSAGDGTADAVMTFKGLSFEINAALEGAKYAPNAGYFGGDTVTVTTDDLGLSGTGGAKTDIDNVAVTVTKLVAPWVLSSGTFSQNWSDINLITANNDWSNVPAILGLRGDGLTQATGADPQLVVAQGDVSKVNVTANDKNPNTNTTGGITEFEITDPVVGLQGSGSARAPQLVLWLNTTNITGAKVQYNLRDIDGSGDTSSAPVALQYRVGLTGEFINIPEAYVANAVTNIPDDATLVTPVSVVLPADAVGKGLVQLRILTTDQPGSDQWVGVDDIVITPEGAVAAPAKVSSVVINDGTPQRSMVTSLKVSFDQAVTLPATVADAFTLTGSQGAVTLSGVAAGDNKSVTLTFGGTGITAGSLYDGKFTLTILADQITTSAGQLDGDGNGTAGGNFVSPGYGTPGPNAGTIFRLFGDSDGNGTVNFNDFLAFRSDFGKTGLVNNPFDFNGDGNVDFNDFLQFRSRFGTNTP